MIETNVKKRRRGRPSKAQRLADFSILTWRSELFLMISDELTEIKKTQNEIKKDDTGGYECRGGAGGKSEKTAKYIMVLDHSNSIIDGAIKAIDKTKKEADLEERLRDAERDKKKLQDALKRLEDEEKEKEKE